MDTLVGSGFPEGTFRRAGDESVRTRSASSRLVPGGRVLCALELVEFAQVDEQSVDEEGDGCGEQEVEDHGAGSFLYGNSP